MKQNNEKKEGQLIQFPKKSTLFSFIQSLDLLNSGQLDEFEKGNGLIGVPQTALLIRACLELAQVIRTS